MSFLKTYARYPVELVSGRGCRVRGADGRWYLDGIAGIAVMALGHGHPAVRAAIHDQVDRLLHASNLFHVPAQRRFAERLSGLYGGALFLCNSGGEANEAAIKLARKYHWRRGDPREEILTLEGAFHGRTLLTLSMTPKPRYQEGYAPLMPGVRALSAEELPGAISERTAAVVVEPVQGEGGCIEVEILPALRAACDASGALLIYDEIQCGLGRTGALHHDPRPDALTLAKALGGGLPLGALVALRPELSGVFAPGDHGSTFGGNPVACAAGSATLEVILGEDLPARCARRGERLRAALSAGGVRVTGRGLMLAAHLGEPVGPVIDRMRELGVLACPAGAEAVRFLPPFVIDDAEIDELAEGFLRAL